MANYPTEFCSFEHDGGNPYEMSFGPDEAEYNGGVGRGGQRGGFDDEFNDGIFRHSVRGTSLSRPRQWPRSPSEMRKHVEYINQGMPVDYNDSWNSYMDRRPYMWRK